MPGLLDNVRQKIGGLLDETGIPELFSGRIGGQTLEQGIQNRMQPNSLRPALSPQQMVEAGLNIAGVAPIGMTVWHGSPHKFDKFDISKIGTGEGAQAYGHGLYLAQAKNVADKYAGKLSQKVIEIPGFTPNTPVEHDLIASLSKRANTTQYGSGARAALDDLRSVERTGQGEHKEAAQKMLSAMGDFGSPVLTDTGHLYKVDIPDEAVARMLDWDKPLSQQAPEVQAALNKLRELPEIYKDSNTLFDIPNAADGEAFYHALFRDVNGADRASASLKALGIPGIRYLDGGSRTAGTGTSNFVLFDDQLPRILERNGVPTGLQPWGPGEWGGTSGLSPGFQNPAPRNSADLLAGVYPWAVPLSAGLLGSMFLLPNDAEAQ